MVLADGNVDGRGVPSGNEEIPADFFAGVVIEDLLCPAPEDDDIFAGHCVPMDGDDRSGLYGVQHSLGFVFLGVSEVVVHTKAGGLFGLFSQAIQ